MHIADRALVAALLQEVNQVHCVDTTVSHFCLSWPISLSAQSEPVQVQSSTACKATQNSKSPKLSASSELSLSSQCDFGTVLVLALLQNRLKSREVAFLQVCLW